VRRFGLVGGSRNKPRIIATSEIATNISIGRQ
jgi:hypothetical protein